MNVHHGPDSWPSAARNCTMMLADTTAGVGASPSLACFAGGSSTSAAIVMTVLYRCRPKVAHSNIACSLTQSASCKLQSLR
jgi:hypothetical protein